MKLSKAQIREIEHTITNKGEITLDFKPHPHPIQREKGYVQLGEVIHFQTNNHGGGAYIVTQTSEHNIRLISVKGGNRLNNKELRSNLISGVSKKDIEKTFGGKIERVIGKLSDLVIFNYRDYQ